MNALTDADLRLLQGCLNSVDALLWAETDTQEGHERKLGDLKVTVAELYAAQTKISTSIIDLRHQRFMAEGVIDSLRAGSTLLVGLHDQTSDAHALELLTKATGYDIRRIHYDAQIEDLTSLQYQVANAIEKLETRAREIRSRLQAMAIEQSSKRAGFSSVRVMDAKHAEILLGPVEPMDSKSILGSIHRARAQSDLAVLRKQTVSLL